MKDTGRRTTRPYRAGGLISKSLPHLGIDSRLREYRIKKDWPLIVGRGLAEKTSPLRLIGKTLYCSAANSAWLTELNYQRRSIIERINAVAGKGAVNEIRFRLGRVASTALPAKQSPSPPKRPDPSRMRFIEKITSRVKDPELRRSIRAAMEKANL